MNQQAFMYQHLTADQDANGNPRRLYMVMDAKGNIIEAIDEVYSGLPIKYNGLVQLPGLYISVKEYKLLLKNFPEK